jgi:hypothetical protein
MGHFSREYGLVSVQTAIDRGVATHLPHL